MAYKTDKMNLVTQNIAGKRHWAYDDTGGVPATVVGALWVDDGRKKGMKVGDFVDITTNTARYAAIVSAVQAEDTGVQGATLVLDTD